jgi:hypothetical protein
VSNWITDYTAMLEACVAEKFGSLCGWGVVAGDQPSLDFCGECDGGGCGQWWIAVQSIYPFTTFPIADDTADCATELGISLIVGVTRCFPIPEDGTPPTHEQHAEAFAEQMADALALRTAIACCPVGYKVALGSWTNIGPDGGCLGGSWSINVAKR